jgi:hypothetical protein
MDFDFYWNWAHLVCWLKSLEFLCFDASSGGSDRMKYIHWFLVVFLPIYLVIGLLHSFFLFWPAIQKGGSPAAMIWIQHIFLWPMFVLR